ncbi:MAG: 16S rRNA (guanine(966)-N(2))-methyltransferase RsmD [Acidobacteria bacterium]|nr:MAG: 16S rRNA (guanine(966)-N(2))-methyltransferase RsmD [Acidobacteriota bacterium]
MRVIAGQYRSRPLRTMRGMDLRPTADRLRETLFDVLTAGNPAALENTVWFDLYAGSGAVGIEALSRSAKLVYFVESSPKAAELIRENLRSLNIHSGFQIIKMDAVRALRVLETQGATGDFFFLDPPYRMTEKYAETLQRLGESQILRSTSVVIAEHELRFDPGEAFGVLLRYRKLEQGDAALSFYRPI